jgi:hypothetical protein
MTVSKLSDNEIAPKRSGSPVVRCDHCRVDHALRDADWARPTATTFGAAIKLAGSLSLAVSLPTMLVGFAHYSRDRSFCRAR